MNSCLSITIPGIRIPIVNNIGSAHLKRGNKWMEPILRSLLKRPGAFYDIGANIGTVLKMVKKMDPDRKCIAIEPNPSCVDYLYRLIRAQGWNDVTVLPLALSSDHHG